MVRTSHYGGIGTIGPVKAAFCHPGEHICAKYPNDYANRQLENVAIIRDGIVCIIKRDQQCYFVNVRGIDHVLNIMTKFFMSMYLL